MRRFLASRHPQFHRPASRRRGVIMTIANLRRAVVAVSVAAGAGIGLGSLLLQPVMPDDPAEFVATLASSPGAGIGMQLFVFSQLFWAIGLVGVGHLASRRAPIL